LVRADGQGREWIRAPLVLGLAAAVLIAAALLRSFEYDEAYSIFVTSGVARPLWPSVPFTAGSMRWAYTGSASLVSIARALRQTDVHPPLYFWMLHLWRAAIGESLFTARLLSVLLGLGSLALVGRIAGRTAIPPALAMLLTLGCYGFAYTNAIARGFALAQLLVLGGVLLALSAAQRRSTRFSLCAGLLLGGASFANYLACFIGVATVLWLFLVQFRRWRLWGGAAVGLLAFVPADLWFFLAQRDSRTGQFPPFEWLSGLARLMRCAAGAVLGGLPLYLTGAEQAGVGAMLAVGLAALLVVIAARWRHIAWAEPRLLFALAAVAPPTGLILLGLVFDNTPIELRYLSFSVPFLALLSAGALGSLPRRQGGVAAAMLIGVQALAIAGLLTRSETMQPARFTARAASALAGPHGVVLLPRGNDGVGVVGPFLAEAPGWLRVLLIGQGAGAEQIETAVGGVPRVVLALEEPDTDSRAQVRDMRAAFANPCWRRAAEGFNVIAYDRVCARGSSCCSQDSR
jgi:4-amino-4-deoxy-L-arabinose transferase-like glycosyltransferase